MLHKTIGQTSTHGIGRVRYVSVSTKGAYMCTSYLDWSHCLVEVSNHSVGNTDLDDKDLIHDMQGLKNNM